MTNIFAFGSLFLFFTKLVEKMCVAIKMNPLMLNK